MVIYNVTVSIDLDIEEAWVSWMKKTHILEVMGTQYFFDYVFLKMLTTSQDETGVTYAIQYRSRNLGLLEKYLNEYAPIFQKKMITQFGDKLVSFRSVLEEIS